MSDCGLCESGAGGGSHTRRGRVYSGTCKECEREGTTAKYFGESGRTGYHRMTGHARDIKVNNIKNAFSKHLQLKISRQIGRAIDVLLQGGGDLRVLPGQVRITLGESDELLNSKSEYHQLGVTRVDTTREVAERPGYVQDLGNRLRNVFLT